MPANVPSPVQDLSDPERKPRIGLGMLQPGGRDSQIQDCPHGVAEALSVLCKEYNRE